MVETFIDLQRIIDAMLASSAKRHGVSVGPCNNGPCRLAGPRVDPCHGKTASS